MTDTTLRDILERTAIEGVLHGMGIKDEGYERNRARAEGFANHYIRHIPELRELESRESSAALGATDGNNAIREALERLASDLDGYGMLPAERQLARVLVVRLRAIANLSPLPPEEGEATDALRNAAKQAEYEISQIANIAKVSDYVHDRLREIAAMLADGHGESYKSAQSLGEIPAPQSFLKCDHCSHTELLNGTVRLGEICELCNVGAFRLDRPASSSVSPDTELERLRADRQALAERRVFFTDESWYFVGRKPRSGHIGPFPTADEALAAFHASRAPLSPEKGEAND